MKVLDTARRRMRRPKPALMEARVRAATSSPEASAAAARRAVALVVGAAAAGAMLAKILDWRGHAHPRL